MLRFSMCSLSALIAIAGLPNRALADCGSVGPCKAEIVLLLAEIPERWCVEQSLDPKCSIHDYMASLLNMNDEDVRRSVRTDFPSVRIRYLTAQALLIVKRSSIEVHSESEWQDIANRFVWMYDLELASNVNNYSYCDSSGLIDMVITILRPEDDIILNSTCPSRANQIQRDFISILGRDEKPNLRTVSILRSISDVIRRGY